MGRLRAVGTISALVTALALAGCGQSAEPQAAAETARPVDVVAVATEPLTLTSELPGRIEPMRVAEVRARVAGIILQKRFEEGADVKAGDLLFQIDPAPLKAAVSRAEGDLARAQAAQQEAQARVKRYEPLVKIEAVSQQDFDTATADLRSAQASVRSAQADLETARLNLGYASVKAPISGRIGRALVTEGALVGQGDATLMARIQQLDPIYADFTQPVADALRLREALKSGNLPAGQSQVLSLRVEGTPYERKGELLFTDISVDRGTGQVSLRGKFDNADGLLLPGMYVRVTAPQGTDAKAILVPQRAVQRATDGTAHVLVIGAENRVETRQVQTGAMQGSRWQISQGLASGDQVIVGGLTGLQPGAKVEARHAPEQQQASRQ
ncbi:MexC family multidrug efflux RND transporter periplasmic adaptor subunit [Pseudomonas sp. GD04087]|uniref:MexC family multidrug efflux RND transporter periplasmic adaptor subunit n=1 Tax=unclassified Pseudomonas TaxID=196821 RepID=UPI002449328A|nr:MULTISPECIES: MexC family multidrug efflux RND transporter periplasmic adaptor subunit [unclassified Pseudomonas]MDH0292890.1 MexC family multidrug efflux RND transporter periplasmic adaptor subunit [Pseudomonas sp. GD04087]MDH1050034.1 MexC family multidrug efflux RND transporter periplasmic adaptor subunit [Pseudomonas sp. GD03903]MDH2001876.1 MexC family multidrug efflux RND transporter periplasmic adaptor subunit [Pseudomonas sp. GD03691]